MKKKNDRILIDLGSLKYEFNGLDTYCKNYAVELIRQNSGEFNFTFLVPEKYLGFFGDMVQYEQLGFLRKNNYSLFCTRYKLWHSLAQTARYSAYPGDKVLLTIHDLNFLFEKGTT